MLSSPKSLILRKKRRLVQYGQKRMPALEEDMHHLVGNDTRRGRPKIGLLWRRTAGGGESLLRRAELANALISQTGQSPVERF